MKWLQKRLFRHYSKTTGWNELSFCISIFESSSNQFPLNFSLIIVNIFLKSLKKIFLILIYLKIQTWRQNLVFLLKISEFGTIAMKTKHKPFLNVNFKKGIFFNRKTVSVIIMENLVMKVYGLFLFFFRLYYIASVSCMSLW